jgi:hypothetical protein
MVVFVGGRVDVLDKSSRRLIPNRRMRRQGFRVCVARLRLKEKYVRKDLATTQYRNWHHLASQSGPRMQPEPSTSAPISPDPSTDMLPPTWPGLHSKAATRRSASAHEDDVRATQRLTANCLPIINSHVKDSRHKQRCACISTTNGNGSLWAAFVSRVLYETVTAFPEKKKSDGRVRALASRLCGDPSRALEPLIDIQNWNARQHGTTNLCRVPRQQMAEKDSFFGQWRCVRVS